jgi:hypothetical protein
MRKTELLARTEALRALEQKAFSAQHGRTDFYEYLDGVLELRHDCREENKIKATKDLLASLYGLKVRKGTRLIRLIIDASSMHDAYTRSEWTRALRLAISRGIKRGDGRLKQFFKDNGGVAGCAREFGQRRKRKS